MFVSLKNKDHLRGSGPYHHRYKKISVLINDWLPASVILFMLYENSQPMGLGAQPQGNFAIYTFIFYISKQYFH